MPSKQTREGYWKKRYAENREAILAKQKEYASSEKGKEIRRERYRDNRDEILTKRKVRFDSNKETLAAKKAAYDKQYRLKKKEELARTKKAYYEKNKEAIKQQHKINRAKPDNKAKHLEYIKTENYRKYKQNYDIKHRNLKRYGEFWECAILINKIKKKVVELVPDKLERLKMRGQYSKIIKRAAKRRHIMYGWNYNY